MVPGTDRHLRAGMWGWGMARRGTHVDNAGKRCILHMYQMNMIGGARGIMDARSHARHGQSIRRGPHHT